MIGIVAALWLAAQIPPVDVPPGRFDLLADPQCTVGYRLDSGESYELGYRWQGFDPDSGVYFVPEEYRWRHRVFMHCPWRKGPGIAYADFLLRLPDVRPIRLVVGTAIREGAKKTDGVTYRVLLDGRTLWQTHCTWRDERAFTIDLSRWSGRLVTVRLEVDPGPKRNTTDDWSLWTQATIEAGDEMTLAAARARELRRQRERLAAASRAAERSLRQAAAPVSDSARPTPTEPVQIAVSQTGGVYTLACRAPSGTVRYQLDPAKGLFGGLQVYFDDRVLDPAPFIGEAQPIIGGRRFAERSRSVTCELVSARLLGGRLRLSYVVGADGVDGQARLSAEVRAEGKSLVVDLRGRPNEFAGYSVMLAGCRGVTPPFETGSSGRHRSGLYVSAALDMWVSNASSFGAGRTRPTYRPLTDGSRRPLRERFYLTVSPRWEEVMPNVPNRPSPYLRELAHRVVLDVWGGKFDDDRAWLEEMARYGLDGFLIIKHVWQRDGYDHSYPNTMPANAALGGDEALRRLSLTAQRLGHRFCLHENFYDYYPNAEAFREEDCALSPTGKKIPGWFNGTVRAVILKPSKLMDYARRFSTELKRRYDPNAAYHDIMPTWHVDYDARVPNSGMVRVTHSYTRQLCDFDHKLFAGPVVFEAADSFMAGVYDGGCNHGVDTYRIAMAPAFELLKVHCKMSNHGFGYYERWLPWGYGPGWYNYVMTDRELDKYRARTVAFGRTGFIGHQLMKHPHAVVREYYLMQAFGRAYTGRLLERLAYWVDEAGWRGWVDAATALELGLLERLRAVYEGGQVVYVNFSDRPWRLPDARGPRGPVTLPPYSAATFGPRATAMTAVIDGQISDFAQYEDVVYADARSHQWLPPEPPPPITPRLADWQDLGGGRFSLALRWTTARKLDKDYRIFWHFKRNGKILFQDDHWPKPPTSQWPVSKPVLDGPRQLKVPENRREDHFDVVVGLYLLSGKRARLVHGADQMHVATLYVERDQTGAVKRVVIKPAAEPQAPPGTLREPYLEGANRQRRIIDFGPVATNGAVVIRRTGRGLRLVPVPIGERMSVGLSGAWRRATILDRSGRIIARTSLDARGGKRWVEVPAEAAAVELLR